MAHWSTDFVLDDAGGTGGVGRGHLTRIPPLPYDFGAANSEGHGERAYEDPEEHGRYPEPLGQPPVIVWGFRGVDSSPRRDAEQPNPWGLDVENPDYAALLRASGPFRMHAKGCKGKPQKGSGCKGQTFLHKGCKGREKGAKALPTPLAPQECGSGCVRKPFLPTPEALPTTLTPPNQQPPPPPGPPPTTVRATAQPPKQPPPTPPAMPPPTVLAAAYPKPSPPGVPQPQGPPPTTVRRPGLS